MISSVLYRRTAAAVALAATLVAWSAAAQPSQLEANKRIATEFYDAAINRKDFAAASQYLGSAYKQHNPTAADGAEGLRAFIDFLKTRFPNQRGEIKRVIAIGGSSISRVALTAASVTGVVMVMMTSAPSSIAFSMSKFAVETSIAASPKIKVMFSPSTKP
jgi:predicted SnoaL-like aldol condensation-catalyzing enzyme